MPNSYPFHEQASGRGVLVARGTCSPSAHRGAADHALARSLTAGHAAGHTVPLTCWPTLQSRYTSATPTIARGPLVLRTRGTPAVLADLGTDVDLLAIDAGGLYVATSNGMLSRIPLTGGVPVTLATAPRKIVAAASDGQNVYFAVGNTWGLDIAQSDGQLMRVPVGGGAAEALATAQASTTAVAIAEFVYWTNQGTFSNGWGHDGSIARMEKMGGAIENVANALDQPTALIVDDSGIVWATPWQTYTRGKP